MLNMEDFANAVVGVPGTGLNVEQRKLLTIGVELAAKPKLLLFLDEPTSGLDSQVRYPKANSEALTDFYTEFLGHLRFSEEARRCRPSRSLHDPSTVRHPLSGIRSPPLPCTRR